MIINMEITAINNDKVCTFTVDEFKRDVMLCKTILSSAIADGYLKVGQILNGWEIISIA